MYKVLNNLEEINWYISPILATNPHEKRSISGNQQSLVREHFPSKLRNGISHYVTLRHEFFTNQVTKHWNKLPNSVVKAPSLKSFIVWTPFKIAAAIALLSSDRSSIAAYLLLLLFKICWAYPKL